MMDIDKVQKLMQLACDFMNVAEELEIDIDREMEPLLKKIQTVSDRRIFDDLKSLRAALRPLSDAVQ